MAQLDETLFADPFLGRIINGRYQIETLIGSGGMGQVYAGLDIATGHRVAIKFLTRKDLEGRFNRESIFGARVNNVHVIKTLDSGTDCGDQYLVTELVASRRTLKDLLVEVGCLSVTEAVGLVCQALEGLGAIHNEGIIHRDLKPANIMLAEEPDVPGRLVAKIGDFGIAKQPAADHTQTAVNTIVGTPMYVSPEQAVGGKVDQRSDIYTMGVILYEVLAGRPPFTGNGVSIIRQHIMVNPPPLNRWIKLGTLTPRVEAVVRKAMAKDQTERWQTAAEMRQALSKCLVKRSGRKFVTGLALLASLGAVGWTGYRYRDHLVSVPDRLVSAYDRWQAPAPLETPPVPAATLVIAAAQSAPLEPLTPPPTPAPSAERARQYLNIGSYSLAVGEYEKLLKGPKINPEWHFEIGTAHRYLGHNKKAVEAYQAYLSVPGAKNGVNRRLAKTLLSLQKDR